ncbi:uncharacterized protein [Watersipora subatra]|uniref:uncharacterized protein n=1 Tax=Watersipora subatra TaxID=2589382 RepID=UPI00355C62DC
MRYLADLITLCSLATITVPAIVSGSQVELSVDSTGYPSFYRDELITLTCTASGDTDVTAVYLVNGASAADDRNACGLDSNETTWFPTNALNIPGFSRIDEAYCVAAAAAAPPFIFSVTGTISDYLLSADFRCFADFTSIRVNSSSFPISTIIVKPENLVMNKPDQIVEGKEFTFNCTSTGGSPDSVYDYEVLRGNMVVVRSSRYTPVKEDRDGLTLRCKDTTHSVLESVYPDNIIMSEDVEPRYIDYEEEPHYDLKHNPGGPLTLTCKVLTDSNSNPTHEWSCSTCSDADVSDQLVISMNSRQNGQTEQFSCTASIEFMDSIIITWNVTWTSGITIPPTALQAVTSNRPIPPTALQTVASNGSIPSMTLQATQTTTQSTVSVGLTVDATAGIVIGGVVLIGVIVIIFWFSRKNKSNAMELEKVPKILHT